jgi:hypothetical protein
MNNEESKKLELRCKVTGRLLVKADANGLHTLCRQENTEHLITWEKLAEIKLDAEANLDRKKYYL